MTIVILPALIRKMPMGNKLLAIFCGLCLAYGNAFAQNRIQDLPPFERSVAIIKHFEKMHPPSAYPYVGYGHKVLPNEKYTSAITEKQADSLLRSDLKKLVDKCNYLGKDAILVATLCYNVGLYRIIGCEKLPKSTLVRKLEAGDRNIYREYIAYCHYKGKAVSSLELRRRLEFELLYVP